MRKKDHKQIMLAFARIRSRQILAIAAALSLAVVIAVIARRPDVFGAFTKKTLFVLQALTILSFVNFSAWNWKCPSCNRYLGHDINRRTCRKCGVRLR